MVRCGAKYRTRAVWIKKKLERAKKIKTKKCGQDQEMRRSSGRAGAERRKGERRQRS